MPYTVSARADQARDELARQLEQLAGLSPRTAHAIAAKVSWRLARQALQELEERRRDQNHEEGTKP